MSRFTQLSGFTTGRATVSVSGTPTQLSATSTEIPGGVELQVISANTNTGTVHIGNSSANANNSTSTVSIRLLPGQSRGFYVDNLTRVWVDSTTSGDVVEYYFER